ncbi:hypothetical protein ACXR0O_13415 [Verrucomicrobiota bacterium sgz303538]
MNTVPSRIESLEARIAPASVITYTDVDGDRVKITSSKGVLDGHAVFASVGSGQQLISLDLTDDSFAHTNLRITVKRVAGGDGFANVGFINAADNDLGRVLIRGDVGRIVAGDANEGTAAIKSLRVHSMGQFGTSTQGGATGGNEIPAGVLGILDDLLGSNGSGGTLGDISSAVSELLDDGLPGDASDALLHTLCSLQSNLNCLLSLTDEPHGCLLGGVTGLLGNITHLISDLVNPDTGGSSVLGSVLTDHLLEVNVKLGELQTLVPGISVSAKIGNLLGLKLNVLLGINLGELGSSAGSILQGLGNTLENLLGKPELAQLPHGLQDLCKEVDNILNPILQGDAPLTNTVAALLVQLQTEVAGLLGIADHATDVLPEALQSPLATANDLVSDLLGSGSVVTVDQNVSLSSDIRGDVGAIKVQTDVHNVFLNIQGDLKKIVIGGSLVGGDLINGGQLLVAGDLGSLRIGKNLIGGGELNSGAIVCNGKAGTITIKGSVIGTDGTHSGSISLEGDLRKLRIGGDTTGGEGLLSGSILDENGGIKSLFVRGALIAGDGDGAGTLRVSNDIAKLRISKGIVGDSEHRAVISAAALETKQDSSDRAFGRIQIGGSVRFADVLAGYGTDLQPINGDAQIGQVKVLRDWVASNLSAGVQSLSGTDSFGAQTDGVISQGNTESIISRIAAIRIKGEVIGTGDPGDQYGFVAEQIGKVVVHKTKMQLSAGAHNDVRTLSQSTDDVAVREVGAVAQS